MTFARRLPDALARSAAGAAILDRFAASQRAAAIIEPEIRRIVPDLAPARSGVCDLRGSTLRVNTHTSAQMAKLRQAAPRLLALLRQQGLDVIEIKFAVQPRPLISSALSNPLPAPPEVADQAAEPGKRQYSLKQAMEFARKLAITLPDSPLRDAARRLQARLTFGLARMRDSDQAREQQDREKDGA